MQRLSVLVTEGSPPVLHVRGELDMATAEEFGAALRDAMSSDPTLVVDMAEVSFVDATGLRVILRIAEQRDGAGPLHLVNARRVERLLELVGLTELTSLRLGDQGLHHVR